MRIIINCILFLIFGIFIVYSYEIESYTYTRNTTDIYQSGDSLLIGTDGGLLIFSISNKNLIKKYAIPEISDNKIKKVYVKNSRIFIGYETPNFTIISRERIINLDASSGFEAYFTNDILFFENFLFIATNNGIFKYDIENNAIVNHFLTGDGLPAEVINRLVIFNNDLYAATPNGLAKYNKQYNYFSTGLFSGNIIDMKEYNGKLYLLLNDKIYNITDNIFIPLSNNNPSKMEIFNNNILIGYFNENTYNIYYYFNNNWSLLSNTNNSNSMYVDNSNIFIGKISNGVFKGNISSNSFVEEHNFIENNIPATNYLSRAIIDTLGCLWIATGSKTPHDDPPTPYSYCGIVKMDNNSIFSHIDNILSRKNIFSIAKDNKNNIWFGTWAQGTIRYNYNDYTLFNNPILSGAMFVDKENNFILSDYWGKLYKLNNNNEPEIWKTFDNSFLPYTGFVDKNNNFWFAGREGTSATIIKLSNGSNNLFYYPSEYQDKYYFSTTDNENYLFFAGDAGLRIHNINDNTWTLINEINNISLGSVRMVKVINQKLLIGTENKGIFVYDYINKKYLERINIRNARDVINAGNDIYVTTWGNGLYKIKDFIENNIKCENDLIFVPNPCFKNSDLKIYKNEKTSGKFVELNVFTIDGKKINVNFEIKNNFILLKIDDKFASGLYMAIVKLNNNKVLKGKFCIIK